VSLAKPVRCYAVKTPTGDLCTQTVSTDPSKPLAMLAKWLGGYTVADLDEMGYRRVVVDVSEPDLYADPRPIGILADGGGR
jgi:hypothetical protein